MKINISDGSDDDGKGTNGDRRTDTGKEISRRSIGEGKIGRKISFDAKTRITGGRTSGNNGKSESDCYGRRVS